MTPNKEPIRHRYLADRILLLLLYKPADPEHGLERLEDGSVALKMGPISRLLKMNSTRLYDQLLFLQHTGYLDLLDHKYKWGWVRVRPTRPLCSWTHLPEGSRAK